jgi:hypothetical protein
VYKHSARQSFADRASSVWSAAPPADTHRPVVMCVPMIQYACRPESAWRPYLGTGFAAAPVTFKSPDRQASAPEARTVSTGWVMQAGFNLQITSKVLSMPMYAIYRLFLPPSRPITALCTRDLRRLSMGLVSACAIIITRADDHHRGSPVGEPKCRTSFVSEPVHPSSWLRRVSSVARPEWVNVSSVPSGIGRRTISTLDSPGSS